MAQNSLVAKLLGAAAQVPRKKGEMNGEAEREMDETQKQKGERNMKRTCGWMCGVRRKVEMGKKRDRRVMNGNM